MGQMKPIWWIHPGKLLLFFLVPVYTFVVYLVPRVWPELVVLKAGLWIRGSYAALGLSLLVAAGAFALMGARFSIDGRQAASPVSLHPRLLAAMGSMVILAYGLWFYPALLSGSLMADRDNMNKMPGITSFTQMGVPFVCCYLAGSLIDGTRYPRLIRLQFWLILGCTVLRVQLWSERLAIIEVGVPALLLLLTHRAPRSKIGSHCYRVIGAVGPFLGVPALLLVFAITEAFRSWTVYSQTQDLPLMQFMTSRLATYYFTALNNGAGMLATTDARWPTFDFLHALDWVYHLPGGVGDAMHQLILRGAEPAGGIFLLRWADVEFNNMSGIFPLVFDLGHVGALLYFCAFGFLAGILYKSMLNGRALGLMFFGPMYVGCLEVMRIAYINGPRATLIFAGATLGYVHLRTSTARRARRAAMVGSSHAAALASSARTQLTPRPPRP